MKLLILRHGKAETQAPTGLDQDRALRPRGERQSRHVAQQLLLKELSPALILSSRFERAIATAHIAQKLLLSPLHTAPELEGGREPSSALELISRHSKYDPHMLVGHNPQLAQLLWVLTKGVPAQDADLRTGECVVLEVDGDAPVNSARELERIRAAEDE
jgi:phosphohistidine phosphatase SixA